MHASTSSPVEDRLIGPALAEQDDAVMTREDSLTVGGLRFKDVPCTFGVQGFHDSADVAVISGKIGNALLRDLILTLDYRHGRVRLER